jgi:hypothetical protein
MVLQDDSGGLAVRLPSGYSASDLSRGTIVTVRGELAAPYGNLELRPGSASDVLVLGSGGTPQPELLNSAGIVEANEGRLGTIEATLLDVARYQSGALSMTVRDDTGNARVYAFAGIGIDHTTLSKGRRTRVTGIVGQRASRSGAADGYRLWPRAAADLTLIAEDPGAGATPDAPSDQPSDQPSNTLPPRVKIKHAKPGQRVTIVGSVTSKAGLIDTEGRRVTVQDRSGAILLRYPAGTKPAGVGRVVRATGEVGTWFGTLQLEAEAKPRQRGRSRVAPTTLRRPPAEPDEWRLASVNIRITDIERSGSTWRAEASLGTGESLPIVGLAGSGIDADVLEPGRAARIVGIVRRAHPSAADQRFAIAPRSRRDIRLGDIALVGSDAEDGDGDGDGGDADYVAEGSSFGIGAAGDASPTVLAATLGSLDTLDDRVVRVGGRVEAIAERRLTLDDGTAQATLRLAASIEPIDPKLQIGEIINATGRVRHRAGGRPEVLVAAAADLRRAASLGYEVGDSASTSVTESSEGYDAAVAQSPSAIEPVATGDVAPLVLVGGLGLMAVILLGSAAWLAWRSRGSMPAP